MRKSTLFWFFVFFMIVLLGSAAVGGYALLQPVSAVEEEVTFIIPKGQSITVIGERLAEAGLIRHPLVFKFVVLQQDLAGKIQAGSFSLSPSLSPIELAHRLTEGTEDVWITLLEGWRAEEMAEYLAAKEELVAFDADAFLQDAATHPGKLYPDTYLIPREMQAEAIVSLLVNTFESKVTARVGTAVEESSRDFDDVLIMASIVQREARDYEQMRHVAGILWNRLDIGMALQVDATLQYVKGVSGAWWPNPTAADKSLVSPFNTYLHAGLPPRPISNPGIEAIQATLLHLDSSELFYIHDPKTGKMYYAKTYEEHVANINKYLR